MNKCVCKERRRRALDEARKQWSTEQDGYYDTSTASLSLRRFPQYTDKSTRYTTADIVLEIASTNVVPVIGLSLSRIRRYTDKSNGSCIESSDTAADSPLTVRRTTPAIPSHHHLH